MPPHPQKDRGGGGPDFRRGRQNFFYSGTSQIFGGRPVTAPRKRATPAKTVAKQPISGAKKGTKPVARQAVSASDQRKRRAKRWKPTAGATLRADLWRATDPGGIKLLVEQACRVADRLETLDRINRGDADAMVTLDLGRILANSTPAGDRKAFYVEVNLVLRDTVGEERQQSKLFGSLLADIHKHRALLPPDPPAGGSAAAERDDLDLDDDD